MPSAGQNSDFPAPSAQVRRDALRIFWGSILASLLGTLLCCCLSSAETRPWMARATERLTANVTCSHFGASVRACPVKRRIQAVRLLGWKKAFGAEVGEQCRCPATVSGASTLRLFHFSPPIWKPSPPRAVTVAAFTPNADVLTPSFKQIPARAPPVQA
jgi:hypothetical protein